MRKMEAIEHKTAFVSVSECARRLDTCDRTVRKWIAAGEIPAVRIGDSKSLRIPESYFENLERRAALAKKEHAA